MTNSAFMVPDVMIVGFGRELVYQTICLRCKGMFFYEDGEIFCEDCRGNYDNNKLLRKRHKSPKHKFGNLVGHLHKTDVTQKRTQRNFLSVLKRDKYTCQYCGFDFTKHGPVDSLSVDHVVPHSYGGSNNKSNLVTCCLTCNTIANDACFDNISAKREYILDRRKSRGYEIYV